MYLLAEVNVWRYLLISMFLGEILCSHLMPCSLHHYLWAWMPRAGSFQPDLLKRLDIGDMPHQRAACILKMWLLHLSPSSSKHLLSTFAFSICAAPGVGKVGAVVLKLARSPHMKPSRLEWDGVMGCSTLRQWVPRVNHLPHSKKGIFPF